MRRTALLFVLAGMVGALVATPIAVYASHSFTDVPGTDTFHADIAWLADAGVTKGCNPPTNTEFCPDDNVSRGQMSAFMRRFAQYIDAEDGIPGQADNATTAVSAAAADDADKVDGKDASDFLGVNAKAADSDLLDGTSANEMLRVAFDSTAVAPDSNGNAVTATITAPQAGWLILSGTIHAVGSTFDFYTCKLTVDGGTVFGTEMTMVVNDEGGTHTSNITGPCSTTGAQQVTAGSHTIALTIGGRTTASFANASVWALFVPFDGLGNTP